VRSLDPAQGCTSPHPSTDPATVYFGSSSQPELNFDSELTLAPADYQTLLEALAQAQKLDQERCTRIHHLEQALDQAIASMEELRSQVQNQHLLESQLANTENYASVQQQAIVRLKLQLQEQQTALDAQILETQQRDQAIQELLATIETLTQAQQREVERLRSRLVQDQQEVQTHRSRLGKHLQDLQTALELRQHRVAELETETLAARTLSTRLQSQLEGAHQQIKELSARLCQNRSQLLHLEAHLEQSHSPTLRSNLSATQPSEEGEKQRSQHLAQQAHWHQQELEADRDRLQDRIADLEQQVAEMQEQILQQAQQETEYETAVQYWKDRYHLNQHQFSHLKELAAEHLLTHPVQDLSPLLMELMNVLQIALPQEQGSESSTGKTTESQPISPLALPRLTTVELPEFLMRRRAAQTAQKIISAES
jgi:DNA repair exonuclease SbcCD ATPase subunit